jgi:hypothetical protein
MILRPATREEWEAFAADQGQTDGNPEEFLYVVSVD